MGAPGDGSEPAERPGTPRGGRSVTARPNGLQASCLRASHRRVRSDLESQRRTSSCPGAGRSPWMLGNEVELRMKTTAAFIMGFYLIIVLALTIGLLVGAPSWIIAAGVFAAGVPFALWLMLRSGRTMRKSLQDSGESS